MNPAVSLLVLIASGALAIMPYLFVAAGYGTFNPEEWDAKNASASIMIVFVFFGFGACFYIVREWGRDFRGQVLSLIDLEELSAKPYLDFILAHYGYVASAASFCAAIVYVAKGVLPHLGITATSVFMSVTVFFVFIVYGLVFAKSTWGVRNRSALAIAMLLPMVALDVTLLQMAIKGAAGLHAL